MDKYEAVVRRIATLTKTPFKPASPASLMLLRNLGFPESVVEFYAQYEPVDCAETPEGCIRLWPITDIVVENAQGVPGICVTAHGYRVFASTMSGDAYCLDVARMNNDGEHPVVLISVGDVGEDSNADDVHKAARPVAASLLEFLEQFADDRVDQGYGT